MEDNKDLVKIMCIKCEKDISKKKTIGMAHNDILDIHIGVCVSCHKKYLKKIRE